MKQSATAGCISTLGARRSPVQTERGVTSFGNDVASSTVSSRRSNANGSAATYKPIIRNSASSFSLSRNSVRFVEQPPVCRVDTTGEPERTLSLSPTSTSSNSFSMQHPNTFERSFDQLANGACIDDCNLPQSAQSAQLASDEERKSNRSEWRNDRSRLRLDLPVQLSKMALSAINGSSHGVGVNGHGNDSFVLTQARLDYPACAHCGRAIDADDQTTNVNGSIWHTTCFTCAQCFRPFKDGIFYEFDGRKYCEEDFNTLFAPCCKRCDAFITGRVIKAMNCNWHPACFCCEECSRCLAEEGFVKNAGRALCRDCNLSAKASSKVRHVCFRCHAEVEDSALLRFRNEVYHAYHFKCHSCSIECNADAREKEGEMFCLRCYDKMGVKICAACRRPIDERVVNAMGKSWHVEHFVCAKCEKPFLGSQHHEKKGQAYCTTHYLMLFGNVCFYCEQVISTEVVAALNKNWCPDHFSCSMCDRKLGPKSKFYDFDLKPVCKACYEKFPSELQKRLKKMSDKK